MRGSAGVGFAAEPAQLGATMRLRQLAQNVAALGLAAPQ